ncbi:NACHT domain-containing protein [Nonomuraea aurantiaca]|uniref:NACHT domain-containing protein n=1 Tax=Nonomuraea aurantiaca TaxID=2878562 RepID=UPI001CDA4ABB|nr:hypothetical protein [Nonomuraea aurantiaca]MCA2229944.1 hypothetical protein [Nonomuraea aurantiaca]
MSKSRSSHSLHRELVRLEELAKAAGQYSRNKVLNEIHDGGNGPNLRAQTVSGWMAQGLIPNEFSDMWAFTRALLRRTSSNGSNNRNWLIQKESEFRGLWEAAKKQAAYSAADRAPAFTADLPEELIDFLNVTRLVSVEHPYPAVLPGATLPPLSQVYVRQHVEPRPSDKLDNSDRPKIAWDKRPAQEIIRGDASMTWLLGGPGAGKSSLLRMIVITLTGQLLDKDSAQAPQKSRRSTRAGAIQAMSSTDEQYQRKPLFPVYLPAYIFTQPGSFAQQVADAVSQQLRGHNYTVPSDDFFRRPPHSGARWLILIDGLDEISDVDERLRVLKSLNVNKYGIYKFIIGSRPLPESELAILDEDVAIGRLERKSGPADRYELLPLDENKLPAFVRGWMDAACIPEPAPAVAAFMDQVIRGRLRELVRNPLMATILCQLHAADPAHPLPRGRYTAYQRFYELLKDRFYDHSWAGINNQLITQLRRYGGQSAAAIDDLPGRLLDTLGQLALRHKHVRGSHSLEHVKANIVDLRPKDMPASRWASLIAQVLRRTGLVIVRADDFNFVHQTLGEFLAARHAACDAHASEDEFRRLSRADTLQFLPHLTSYDRFLIAAWIEEDRSPPELHDLMLELSTSYSSAAGIAELIRDGVNLGDDVRNSMTHTLRGMVNEQNLSKTITAAESLASVDISSAVEILGIVLKSPRISPLYRFRLSKKVIELDPLRAVDVFAELSMSRRMNIIHRDHASDYLMELDQLRAIAVISEMVMERKENIHELIVLTKKLAKLDKALTVNMLTDIIARCAWQKKHHLRLLEWLSEVKASF